MKTITKFIFIFSILISYASIAQVGIGTTTPESSSMLDVESTDKGILIPRMTLAQKLAITNPATGLLVYQTDDNTGVWYYDGTTWFKALQNTIGVIDDLGDGKSDNDGSDNGSSIFLGIDSGFNDDSSDNRNIGIGLNTLTANTTGNNNVAIGNNALSSNIDENFNIAIGTHALSNSTAINSTIAIGYEAMMNAVSGSQNMAIGYQALSQTINSSYNTAVGASSLRDNTTGEYNSALGHNTLSLNTTGSSNTAVGSFALSNNTTGNNNTAIGASALSDNTASNNTAIGSGSMFSNTIGSNNTAIGSGTLFNNIDGSNNIAIGDNVLGGNTSGSFNVALAGLSVNTSGSENIAIGAMEFNTIGVGNTAIGINALFNNVDGNYNTVFGHSAFLTGTNFSNSTAIGYQAEPGASNAIRIGNAAITTIGGFANWTNVSDRRFKTNIKEDIVGLDFILKLRPVSYQLDMDAIAKYNNTPDSLRLKEAERLKGLEIQTGFIAQEVEAAAIESNFNFHGIDKPKNKNDYYGLRYAEFVVPIVKSIQEQQSLIKKNDKSIQKLEQKLEQLETILVTIQSGGQR